MNKVILAPHIDDETIGCWTVIDAHRAKPAGELHVVWFFDLDEERKLEAQRLAREYNLTPHFGSFFLDDLKAINPKEVYVPAITDAHPHHKLINAHWRSKATHFYSVDMPRSKLLSSANQRWKREALSYYFSSQEALWASDAKYYLFEDISVSDIEATAEFLLDDYKITVTYTFQFTCKQACDEARVKRKGKLTPREIIDACLFATNGQAHIRVYCGETQSTWSVN